MTSPNLICAEALEPDVKRDTLACGTLLIGKSALGDPASTDDLFVMKSDTFVPIGDLASRVLAQIAEKRK